MDQRAERDLERLPLQLQRRFAVAFRQWAVDPFTSRSGCDIRRLHGTRPTFAVRVGRYRALFEVAGSTVWITAIAHRRVAYR